MIPQVSPAGDHRFHPLPEHFRLAVHQFRRQDGHPVHRVGQQHLFQNLHQRSTADAVADPEIGQTVGFGKGPQHQQVIHLVHQVQGGHLFLFPLFHGKFHVGFVHDHRTVHTADDFSMEALGLKLPVGLLGLQMIRRAGFSSLQKLMTPSGSTNPSAVSGNSTGWLSARMA